MSLIVCPDCSTAVARHAVACPKCGGDHPGHVATRKPCGACGEPLAYVGRGSSSDVPMVLCVVIASALIAWGLFEAKIIGAPLIAAGGICLVLGIVANEAAKSRRPMRFRCQGKSCKKNRSVIEDDAA